MPQSWKKYIRQAYFCCEIVKYGKTISIFQPFAASIKKILTLEGRLGIRL